MKNEYTLTIYTENHIGLINKIAILFSRRKISLESLNSSPSEVEHIYCFTIVVRETETVVKNLVKQLEKIVDVFKVFCSTNDEIVWQQLALFKVPTTVVMEEVRVERLVSAFGAKAIVIRKDYTIFEVTGQAEEIQNFLNELEPYGLIEFVQSSRVAIIKEAKGIHNLIMEMEKQHPAPPKVSNTYLNQKEIIFQM